MIRMQLERLILVSAVEINGRISHYMHALICYL